MKNINSIQIVIKYNCNINDNRIIEGRIILPMSEYLEEIAANGISPESTNEAIINEELDNLYQVDINKDCVEYELIEVFIK